MDPSGYPAVPVHDWNLVNVFNGEYGNSVREGADELVTHLNHRYGTQTGNWVSNCHNETLILAGYSQGADVIGWALERDGGGGYPAVSAAAKDNIAYVALYGDPKRDGTCNLPWLRGNANCSSVGNLDTRNPYARGEINFKLGSWCDQKDGVCTNQTFPPGNHGWVYKDFWIWQSASEIAAAARIKQCSLNPGRCPGTRLVGDVNGDGRSDAMVMFRNSGTAMVALSNGSSFGTPTSWCYLHTVGASRYFLADVNGDNKDDLVAFWGSNGRWRVSLSSGSGFWPETDWAMGHGVGTANQFVAKVTNDNMADVVTYDMHTGDWYVSASSGSGFWPPERWISGHGVGSSNQMVADFTADGKADAAVYLYVSGSWHIGPSNGVNAFGYPNRWSQGHGLGSIKRYVGDVNGDRQADAAYFWPGYGAWQVGWSSGTGFWTPSAWAYDQGKGSVEQFVVDVTGDRRADLVTYRNGMWWISASDGYGFQGPPRVWLAGHGVGS